MYLKSSQNIKFNFLKYTNFWRKLAPSNRDTDIVSVRKCQIENVRKPIGKGLPTSPLKRTCPCKDAWIILAWI
jgi:hypothetical protein